MPDPLTPRTPSRASRPTRPLITRAKVAAAATVALAAGLMPAGGATAQDAAQVGRFTATLTEDRIWHDTPGSGPATVTDERCVEDPTDDQNAQAQVPDCKPAAVSAAVLPSGDLLYFNGLENLEYFDVDNFPEATNVVAQGGRGAVSDQTRVLRFDTDGSGDYSGTQWDYPNNNRAETDEETSSLPLFGPLDPVLSDGNDERFAYNDQALFCADLNNLYTGQVLAVGGTNYYTEPQVGDTGYGVVELEGTRQSRIYDPEANGWGGSGAMHYGRWYPTVVTLPNGDQLVTSGVTKLIKPVYPYGYDSDPNGAPSVQGDGEPGLSDSGRNVVQTEVYSVETGEWTLNPTSADKTLPLFPRLHLLPNGDVFYNAAGQVYNPQGQAYDQALWNMASVYDQDDKTWTDLGIPGVTGDTSDPTALNPVHPGFRGSASSVMLPLEPDAAGEYTSASFLAAGGTTGVTPGSYFAIDSSYITTVDVSDPEAPTMSGRSTGPLNAPRWYGHGVGLPDGSVLVFSGADRDEVVNPGSGTPITVPEIFDPETETWTQIVDQGDDRTYHNMALLLPDGRVMVGGHSPINDGYALYGAYPDALPLSSDGRNPSIQIYEPPYLHTATPRPVIDEVEDDRVDNGAEVEVETDQASAIRKVALVRNPSVTHLIDADQRTVYLPFEADDDELEVAIPDAAVAPPGDYMLFVMVEDPETGHLVPSVSTPLHINGPLE